MPKCDPGAAQLVCLNPRDDSIQELFGRLRLDVGECVQQLRGHRRQLATRLTAPQMLKNMGSRRRTSMLHSALKPFFAFMTRHSPTPRSFLAV